jgi:parvulin-like peptidyl-prolyl isomerase
VTQTTRSIVIRLLAFCLLLLPIAAVIGCAEDLPDGAVAMVGQKLVSQDQFDNLKAAYEAAGRAPDKEQEEEYRVFEQRLAEYLVMMEVLRQEASAFDATVTEQDVQAEVEKIRQYFQGDEDKFNQALEKQNITLEQLTDSLRDGLLLERMKAAVTEDVSVSESEVETYYEAHKADFVESETRETRHILIAPVQLNEDGTMSTTPTEADWEAARAEAEKVRSEIQNGADFDTEAGKYSDDASTRESGGELGPVTRGQMVPAFEEAVFSLSKGELSQPIRTQYGYHLIEVTDITPEQQLSYDEVKENITSTLLELKQTQTWQEWLAGKQAELGIRYRAGLEPPSASSLEAGQSTTTQRSTTSTSSQK